MLPVARLLVPILLAAASLPAWPAARAALPDPPLRGQVVDAASGRPLPYASVAAPRRATGTVADAEGRFALALPAASPDTLLISLVGYQARRLPVAELGRVPGGRVALAPQPALAEVVVRPQGQARRRLLGNSGNSNVTSAWFRSNRLGNQMGQRIAVRHLSMLEEVSFHVNACTYDSIFYRLNVYRLGPDGRPDEQRSVLPEAVYVRLARAQVRNRIRVNLSRFGLWLEPDQDVAVCLELVRDLGPGLLRFTAAVFSGPMYMRSGTARAWEKVGTVGLGIDATVTEIRPR